MPLPAGDTGKSLPVPPELGGSLDGKSKVLLPFGFLNRLNKQACAAVEISFDLSVLGSADSGEFGVALRSPTDSLSAALTMAFTASTPDASGTRMLHVRTSGSVLGPLPLLTVLQGEQLTIRALIDRASQTSDASCVRQLSRLTERVVAARPLHRGAQHSLFR